MSATSSSATGIVTGLRWTARSLALAIGSLVFLLAVGEGFNPAKLKASELVLTMPFLLAWIGLWLGWRWEGLGGILIVTGVAAFYLVHFVQTGFGRFPNGWAFPLLAAPGLLFLTCWFLRRKPLQ